MRLSSSCPGQFHPYRIDASVSNRTVRKTLDASSHDNLLV